MSPFRTRPDEHARVGASAEVHDAVGHMVQQFADPMAWLRELVQNAIDAGATRIDGHLECSPTSSGRGGTVEVSITDDGAGMDQATVERCLLVLFRSSKDRDPTKIGKFGVGFFSVFAVSPRVVVVETGRDRAPEGLRLTLAPDFSYELEATPPRRGTTVRLTVDISPSKKPGDFARDALAALKKWCPHIEVPLRFTSHGLPDGDLDEQVDRPFEVTDGVSWAARDEQGARYVVTADPQPGARFFNRGILLHDTDEALVANVRFMVDDRALHHTVSRDDVRRDAAFHRCVDRAKGIAEGPLKERCVAVFRAAADASANARAKGESEPSAADVLARLARVVHLTPFSLDASALAMPLTDPIEGALTHTFTKRFLGSSPRYYAPAKGPITRALAKKGVPVVDLGAASGDTLLPLLRALHGDEALSVDARFTVVTPRAVHDLGAGPMRLAATLDTLRPAFKLTAFAFATLRGPASDRLFVSVDKRASLWTDPSVEVLIDHATDNPYALSSGRGAVFNLEHPRVARALAVSQRDPALAALILARLMALAAGALTEERDAELHRQAILGAGAS
ncbi:MAG: ATP-binding protein [Polyangiales bacterium]